MKRIPVIHLARVLRVLILAVLVMNILGLLLVPGIVAYVSDGGPAALVQAAQAELQSWLNAWQGREAETHFPMLVVFLAAWPAVWTRLDTALLTLFYWLCGGCTAVILWQAKRVLDTILTQTPFLRANAGALKRAAVCCWVISGAALVRLVLWLWSEGNVRPLFTYTALFIPAFFMGGLLFLVMSALFRQAAELKEDQDLTI